MNKKNFGKRYLFIFFISISVIIAIFLNVADAGLKKEITVTASKEVYTRTIKNETYAADEINIMGYKPSDYAQIISFILSKAEISDQGLESINLNGLTLREHVLNAAKAAYLEDVNLDVVITQQINETGFYSFDGSMVKPTDNNYAGLGAIDKGNSGNGFPNNETGQMAQVQHLKAYASTDDLNSELVDSRFRHVKRGSSPTVDGLSKTWASNPNYGEHLSIIYSDLLNHETNMDLVNKYADFVFGQSK